MNGFIQIDSKMFFDKPAVMAAVDSARRKALSKGGAYIRRTAKNLIKNAPAKRLKEMSAEELKDFKRRVALADYYGRKRPKKPRVSSPAAADKPPYNRTGLLRQFIYFGYERETRSVVIGPMKLNAKVRQSRTAPNLLEFGGTVARDGKSFKYNKHPFMRPALVKESPKLPLMFGASVRS